MYEHGFKGTKPVEEGKEYTVTISDVGSQGDGVAKIDGFIVFVPETKVGQTVKVKVVPSGSGSTLMMVAERGEKPALWSPFES